MFTLRICDIETEKDKHSILKFQYLTFQNHA
jgi:hypothetical protein